MIIRSYKLNSPAAARSRGAMHPEEREEANVRARMALVEIVRESRALVERSSHRGPVEGANGEKMRKIHAFHIPCTCSLFSSGAFSHFDRKSSSCSGQKWNAWNRNAII